MRANEFITELFDKPLEWKWVKNTNMYHAAKFNINDKTYDFYVAKVDDETTDSAWEIGFELETPAGMPNDVSITKSGDQHKVFSTVIAIMKDFMSWNAVSRLYFSSEEPSRTKLYNRMVDTLLPNWHKEVTSDWSDGEFMVTHPHHHSIDENYDEDEEEPDYSNLQSVNSAKQLAPMLAKVAQEEYDKWDEEDIDTYANGGICHYIADRMSDVLHNHHIECAAISSSHEQHVYVAAQFQEGVYIIDLPYHTYETGGGFNWKKIPDVEFDERDITFYRVSANPGDYEDYIEY